MYYLINEQATTITFYFLDGTADFSIEELYHASQSEFEQLIQPFAVGENFSDALAFKADFSPREARELMITTRAEIRELLSEDVVVAISDRKCREDALAMTIGLFFAAPFLYLVDEMFLESIGVTHVLAEVGGAALTIFLLVSWIAIVWTNWGTKIENKIAKKIQQH